MQLDEAQQDTVAQAGGGPYRLRYGIRGNSESGLRVPRCLSCGQWPEEMDDTLLTWADEPSDTRPGPVEGAPAIASWWDADLG
ncbi:hypothetical protein ACFUVQ_13690 [Streptomyces rochei]|uniref:hypothetical protein n=1 Tax=Streptomyces rochei TaxID=1928 RepID=UPI003630B4A2